MEMAGPIGGGPGFHQPSAFAAYRAPDLRLSYWRTAAGIEVDFVLGDSIPSSSRMLATVGRPISTFKLVRRASRIFVYFQPKLARTIASTSLRMSFFFRGRDYWHQTRSSPGPSPTQGLLVSTYLILDVNRSMGRSCDEYDATPGVVEHCETPRRVKGAGARLIERQWDATGRLGRGYAGGDWIAEDEGSTFEGIVVTVNHHDHAVRVGLERQ